MNLSELKAYAYDTIAQIQYLQKQLNDINQKIAEEAKKPQEMKEEASA